MKTMLLVQFAMNFVFSGATLVFVEELLKFLFLKDFHRQRESLGTEDSQTKEVTGIDHCSPALKCLNFSKNRRERSELFEFYLPQYLKLQVFQIYSDKFRKVQ